MLLSAAESVRRDVHVETEGRCVRRLAEMVRSWRLGSEREPEEREVRELAETSSVRRVGNSMASRVMRIPESLFFAAKSSVSGRPWRASKGRDGKAFSERLRNRRCTNSARPSGKEVNWLWWISRTSRLLRCSSPELNSPDRELFATFKSRRLGICEMASKQSFPSLLFDYSC